MLRFLFTKNSLEDFLRIFLTGLACALLGGAAIAQSNSQPVLKPRNDTTVQDLPSAGAEQKISPDTPVITVNGVCDQGAGAADCKTVVTRAEFEKIVNALQPNMPKQQQKALANQYAMALLLAGKAHEQGLDK